MKQRVFLFVKLNHETYQVFYGFLRFANWFTMLIQQKSAYNYIDFFPSLLQVCVLVCSLFKRLKKTATSAACRSSLIVLFDPR